MTDMVLTRVAALKTTPTPSLKKMWQELFDIDPPAYNRRFLEALNGFRGGDWRVMRAG